MNKDWTGTSRSVFVTTGASYHSVNKRQSDDYYSTEPKATELLLQKEVFSCNVLEPACGGGHMSKVIESKGYNVTSFDIKDRGYGGVQDFFLFDKWNGDIITNPPYKYAKQFVEHALEIIENGHKVAMLLKLTFLEGKARKRFFALNPPQVIYVNSSRIYCFKNGIEDRSNGNSAIAYAWFVWVKGFKGDPIIKWVN